MTDEHRLLRESSRQIVDQEINPHVEAWEEAKRFPAHDVLKIFGMVGPASVLINKFVE